MVRRNMYIWFENSKFRTNPNDHIYSTEPPNQLFKTAPELIATQPINCQMTICVPFCTTIRIFADPDASAIDSLNKRRDAPLLLHDNQWLHDYFYFYKIDQIQPECDAAPFFPFRKMRTTTDCSGGWKIKNYILSKYFIY